jgi:hypothetical protein
MSAATFRRSGKIEQARGAIQEAEVRDEENPNVWVQVSGARLQPEFDIVYLTLELKMYSWVCTTQRVDTQIAPYNRSIKPYSSFRTAFLPLSI